MDYLSSTIHEYQPILVGAGCLAFGYMCGRHCRCLMENQVDAPTTSDAACCAGTESFNYIPEPAAVDPETMAMVRQWLNPAEADWVRMQTVKFSSDRVTDRQKIISICGIWLGCRVSRTESLRRNQRDVRNGTLVSLKSYRGRRKT